MRDVRVWLALAGIVAGGWLISLQLQSADSSSPVLAEELATAVFVCRESGEIFVGKVRTTPAVHPKTGRPTLMPGLYAPDQQKWVAGPSFEELQRSTPEMKSAKTKTPLLREGPIPATAVQI